MLYKSFSIILPALILFTALIRIFLACNLNLGNDEVYYFTYAVQPDWNHFDHPPLIGLFIRLTTLNLYWLNDLSMRLPAIIGAAINTWLITKCVRIISSDRAAIFAAIFYNTSFYTSIISGLFILPDSVQVVFWMTALYTMIQLVYSDSEPQKSRKIIFLGIWIGLAMMCKVHGIFLWLGFLGYILFHQTAWFKNPFLYIAIALTGLIISPILFWNINNDFITWRFHSERVTAQNGIHLQSFVLTEIGQILYANPVQFLIYCGCLGTLLTHGSTIRKSCLQLLLWCSLPMIITTSAVSLFRDTLPHWSGPGFIGIIILSAVFLDAKISFNTKSIHRSLLKGAVALTFLVCIAGLSLIHFFPGTLSDKAFPETGSGDFTLDLYGWNELATSFEKFRKNDIAHSAMSANDPLISNKWFPAAHLYYYVAYPLHMRFLGKGSLSDLHKFHWLNHAYEPMKAGSDAYYIAVSNNFTDPYQSYGSSFQRIEKVATFVQKRNGKIARYWFLYRLKNAL